MLLLETEKRSLVFFQQTLSPIGGMIADRINKRNIMVALDFLTAIITLLFTLYFSQINLTVIILVMLTLLYGIDRKSVL